MTATGRRNLTMPILAGVCAGMLLMAGVPCKPVLAAETVVTPSIEVRQEYTDNLFYTPTGSTATFITRVSPGIKASAGSEAASGSLMARLSGLHYSADSSMDAIDQKYEGTTAYRFDQRLSLSVSAAYRLESEPGREIETNGLPQSSSSRHTSCGVGVTHLYSELATGTMDYGYDQVSYSGNTTGSSSVATHRINLGVEQDADQLLPLLKIHGGVRYYRSDYDAAQIDNFEMVIGAARQLHERWKVSAEGGGSYTRSAFQIGTGAAAAHEQNDSASWLLKAGVAYTDEALRGTLAFNRSVSSTSGNFGSAVEQDALTLSLHRQYSYELSAGISAGFYRSTASKNQFGGQAVDENSWRASLSMRYEFNRFVSADAGYDFFVQERSSAGGTAFTNKIFVQLTAKTNFFE